MLTLRQRLSLEDLPTHTQISLDAFRGIAFAVESALFSGSAISDLSGISSVTMLVKASREDTESAALMASTVAAADFGNCTLTQWVAGTHQHVTFAFDAAEANLDLQGSTKRILWLVFKALFSSGDSVILGRGFLTLHEANAEATGTPPENPAPALSAAEADARFVRFDGAQTLQSAERLQALTNLGLAWLAGASKAGGKITLSDGSVIWIEAPAA
jgi:hypothetical protein